jgi:hypothetical protein
MFEPCPLIDHKICACCFIIVDTKHCGLKTEENRISEMKDCPKKSKKKVIR